MLRSAQGVSVDFAEKSHPGLDPDKQLNEDSAGSADTPLGCFFVLCDGMGGHSAGEVASRTAVQKLCESLTQTSPEQDPVKALHVAIEAANSAVFALRQSGPQMSRPGSTCVAVLMHASGMRIAHVGDSRAYLVRGREIRRCTRDHSVVGELVAAGAITPEQGALHPGAHQITRALGIQAKVVGDVSAPLAVVPGDFVMMCSDGLTDLVSDGEILEKIAGAPAADAACAALVALALERGGHDNVTVQCLHVSAVDNAAGPTAVDLTPPPSSVQAAPTLLEAGKSAQDTLIGTPPTVIEGTTPIASAVLPVDAPPTERPRVAPTVVDTSERATPIAPFPTPPAVQTSGPERAQSPAPNADAPSLQEAIPPRRGHALVYVSTGFAVAIVLAIVLWWIAGGAKHHRARRSLDYRPSDIIAV